MLLMSIGYTSRLYRNRDSGAAKVLTQSQTSAVAQTETTGCSKIMWRSLCKDYGNFIIEGLCGLKQDDLDCLSDLCNKKNVPKCCDTITDLTNAIKGQSPNTLRIAADKFNRLAAITNGAVAAVNASQTHGKKPGGKKYVPKPKVIAPKPVDKKKMPGPKPWAAELGWDLDAGGKFHYSSGGKKADLSVVPDGCHAYAHVDLCFSPRQGDAWVLGSTRNKKLEELQCIGYLCRALSNAKCCSSMEGIKAAINGKNWYDLAEYEEHFDRLLRATGEYLD